MTHVAIIGAGQQGTSIARALATRSDQYTITAYDIAFADHEKIEAFEASFAQDALRTNITPYNTLDKAIEDADIIVLATPIHLFADIIRLPEMQRRLAENVILTDVGSAKAESERMIKQVLPVGAVYVPAHPIVGNAGQGPATSNADMYRGETVAIIPSSNPHAMSAVKAMWKDAGANTRMMSALQHDRLLGTISHLEHFGVAFPLAELLGADPKQGNSQDYRDYGNLTLDITRIANASAPMWEAISVHNRAQIVLGAQGLRGEMNKLKAALQSDNPRALVKLLKPAHEFRSEVFDVKPRIRESLKSAVDDHVERETERGNVNMALYDKTLHSLSRSFNRLAAAGFARRVTLPAFISSAVALNAMNLEKEMGDILIRGAEGLRNPSFCDGSSVMLNDPGYVAKVLHVHRTELLVHVAAFEEKQDEWINRVLSQDGVGAEIERIAAVRRAAPSHRTGEALRARHDVAIYAPRADAAVA